jgi:hypothetical protein
MLNMNRLQKSREELPEYHQAVLKDRYEQLQQLQDTLNHRQAQINTEESRRTIQLENMKKEAMDEIRVFRNNVEEDLAGER